MADVIEAVATEVKAVEEKVEAVVEKVEAVAEKVLQELSAEEKLAIREIEVNFLKAQAEIQRLTQITQKAQTDFTAIVETLTKKYAINPAAWVFDNVTLVFRKR